VDDLVYRAMCLYNITLDNGWISNKDENTMITPEMERFFIEKILKHQRLVDKYCKRIISYRIFPASEVGGLLLRAALHDSSKLKEPERVAYTYISWRYKKESEGKTFVIPEEINHRSATLHHVMTNSHHPEHHQNRTDILIYDNRDSLPQEMVDAREMPLIDILEMCADWCAMSEEVGGNPVDWARENICKRWLFTAEQQKWIYKTLEEIWDGK